MMLDMTGIEAASTAAFSSFNEAVGRDDDLFRAQRAARGFEPVFAVFLAPAGDRGAAMDHRAAAFGGAGKAGDELHGVEPEAHGDVQPAE